MARITELTSLPESGQGKHVFQGGTGTVAAAVILLDDLLQYTGVTIMQFIIVTETDPEPDQARLIATFTYYTI
jgi:hypothetical protein